MTPSVRMGQCDPGASPAQRLDPRVKLVACVLFMAGAFLVDDAATLAWAAIAVGAAVAASRVRARRLLAQIRPLVVFFVLTSLINLFFIRTGEVVWAAGPVTIHADGARGAVLYTARFFLLLVAGALLMRTTTPLALADALERLLRPFARFGVKPTQVAMVFTLALRFVPTLSQEARTIVAAQSARGAQWELMGPVAYARACVPLLVPLFTSALRHAAHLGRAMEARAYTGEARTHLRPLRLRLTPDGAFCAAMACYLVILVALYLR